MRKTEHVAILSRSVGDRRGVRMNSRVPVTIEWENASGQSCQQQGHTRVVGSTGCMVIISAEIDVAQSIRLTNGVTQRSSAAVVIWRGRGEDGGSEMGIELIEPETDFWGLEL